jgi:hypothetical protein
MRIELSGGKLSHLALSMIRIHVHAFALSEAGWSWKKCENTHATVPPRQDHSFAAVFKRKLGHGADSAQR